MPPRVVCKGISDPFGIKAIVMGELLVAEQYADALAERRAVHRTAGRSVHPEGPCQRIVDRAWEETVPALTFAGAPTDSVARLHYLQASLDVIASCSAEPLQQRLCALTTPKVLEAARACPPRRRGSPRGPTRCTSRRPGRRPFPRRS
ncbi:hypothetical protein OV079_51495 [Nannocystis pusilla]|uniref:Uncharacterized protein n=1 Tax=Nannocystis pusilla TaxID=889268 RepID=A0A9X3F0Z9_9BACT|nr:hypothetical protein [Nannocystis pusilla]MCY1013816.1 hypothetical protein [Nannocystis pusilla]